MRRKIHFLTAALSGTLLLGGCASSKKAWPKYSEESAADPTTAAHQRENWVRSSATQPGVVDLAKDPALETASPFSVQPVSHAQEEFSAPDLSLTLPEPAPNLIPSAQVAVIDSNLTVAGAITHTPVPINLPTALAMIGQEHPVVGFAQWRVKEAYAQLDRANVMWLPSIQTGVNYRRRDGNYQAVDGAIVDVNLNSLNYGLGSGAVAAGSPTRPGVVAQFHLADALFLPKAAEKTATARKHAASAAINQQMLQSGIAYIDLLEAYQDAQIVQSAVERTTMLAKMTDDFAEAGAGLKSEADRTATELSLLKTRQLTVRERQLVASTRLARALSLPMTSSLLPQDTIAVPIEMISEGLDEPSLISTGLTQRPELNESQALVAAACEAYKREKYAPFVPSVLLGFSTTNFGGGLGSNAENFGGRYDIDAMMVWEMRNLGFGEGAARRERTAQKEQATFAKLRIMDQVAQEVAEANIQVGIRKQQIFMAQSAIASAADSYRLNVDRIGDGQGLPIEVLQSIQAYEAAERAYLKAVSDFNRSQLQLQWALGWPVNMAPR